MNHASVLVDDLAYPDEPFFEDGPIANAANAATAAGVPHLLRRRQLECDCRRQQRRIVRDAALPQYVVPVAGHRDRARARLPRFPHVRCQRQRRRITLAPGGGFAVDLQWAQPRGRSDLRRRHLHHQRRRHDRGWLGDREHLVAEALRARGLYQHHRVLLQTVHIILVKYSGSNACFKFVFVGSGQVLPASSTTPRLSGDIVGPSVFGHNGAATVAGTAAQPLRRQQHIRGTTCRAGRSRCTSNCRRATPRWLRCR